MFARFADLPQPLIKSSKALPQPVSVAHERKMSRLKVEGDIDDMMTKKKLFMLMSMLLIIAWEEKQNIYHHTVFYLY